MRNMEKIKMINEGTILKLVCQKINPRTLDGIFTYKGLVIIAKDTTTCTLKPYFEYKLKITKMTRNCAFAEVEK